MEVNYLGILKCTNCNKYKNMDLKKTNNKFYMVCECCKYKIEVADEIAKNLSFIKPLSKKRTAILWKELNRRINNSTNKMLNELAENNIDINMNSNELSEKNKIIYKVIYNEYKEGLNLALTQIPEHLEYVNFTQILFNEVVTKCFNEGITKKKR